MGDEYQLRKDIDRIEREYHELDVKVSKTVSFADNSPLHEYGTTRENTGTLDGILGVLIDGGGGGDLSDYVKKTDLIDKNKYDIDLNLSFGLKGQDDTIVIDMDIVDYIVDKEINLRGV